MNEYLIMYKPNPQKDNKYYPSLHIWPEILTILIKMQEVGEGKLKTGKPPKKSIANKPAGNQ